MFRENPRSARDVDFAILEKKLAILERNQKMKALEINSGLKDIYNAPIDEEAWQQEKEKLLKIIKQKNKEIKSFRQELDNLLGQLEILKKKKA